MAYTLEGISPNLFNIRTFIKKWPWTKEHILILGNICEEKWKNFDSYQTIKLVSGMNQRDEERQM